MQNKTGKYIVFCRDENDMQEAMEKAKGWFAKVNPNMWIDYVYSGHQDSKMRKSLKLNRQTMNEFKRPSSENKDKLKLLSIKSKLLYNFSSFSTSFFSLLVFPFLILFSTSLYVS